MEIKDSAKTIVCYGDSNTWGRIPGNERYPRSVRWTGVLQKLLGGEYEIINEGLNGRTFVAVDPQRPYRTGVSQLESILQSHKPVDAVVIMLGTNDVKTTYNLTAQDIARHLDQTIALVQKENISKILIVCPTEIILPEVNTLNPDFVNGPEISIQLPALYKNVAEKYSCNFLNAQDYISSSKIDGFHLEPEAHATLAGVIKDELLKMKI